MATEYERLFNREWNEFERNQNLAILGFGASIVIAVIGHYIFDSPLLGGILAGVSVVYLTAIRVMMLLRHKELSDIIKVERKKGTGLDDHIEAYRRLEEIKTNAEGERLDAIEQFEIRRKKRQTEDRDELDRLTEELENM